MIKLPGLIDPHVHVRDLAQAHKEDWASATAAALAGGFTTILAMPNTQPPVTDAAALAHGQVAARTPAPAAIMASSLGAGPGQSGQSRRRLAAQTAGLKLYLDPTFGPLHLDQMDRCVEHLRRLAGRLVVAGARRRAHGGRLILLAVLAGRSIHICHVSHARGDPGDPRRQGTGWRSPARSAPHHLFLTLADDQARLAAGGEVRPRLAAPADVAALLDEPGRDRLLCHRSRPAHPAPRKRPPTRRPVSPAWRPPCRCC